ncbi:MAG TPA: LysE family translocator [Candidatus Limnocylindria bacterium]|jgi:homoserine/homoserine lactone efflux protein|nr:LysE family translocator [Candidatus Limnocylindria bacterium]
MIDVKVWAAFAVLEVVLCFVPGPAVLLVVGTALRRGAPPALRAALGILAGNTIYFGLSALGLGAVLASSFALFTVVKYAGAAYLAYLGVRAILAKPAVLDEVSTSVDGFTSGLVTQLANPKAIVFFAALLPQFVNPHVALWPQILILAVTSGAIELSVLALYALAGTVARRAVRSPAVLVWTERVGGTLLLGAAARLAAVRA